MRLCLRSREQTQIALHTTFLSIGSSPTVRSWTDVVRPPCAVDPEADPIPYALPLIGRLLLL